MHGEDVAVEAVLGRPVVDVGIGSFVDYLADARILVTGAAGSVGTELCTLLTHLGIRELVLIDHAEGPLIGLATTLRDELGFARAVPVLADITSRTRMAEVFARHSPDVAFHAAAYKQVPLLEASPVEGVTTNVLGTRWVVDAARRAGVGRFVLFSTDKAVQPTSILGQTKAVAEWIVAAADRGPGRGRYVSVRLGNVVDSAGSIVPVFRRQVERGGPVTVTHPEATRYLMTAREAADLAVVAGGLADSDSVYWLDMGPPVRVIELATRLASSVSQDVGIELVGLRPGERLHEQLFSSGDEISPTACECVWRSRTSPVDQAWLNDRLAVLARHVRHADAVGVRATLAEMHSSLTRETMPSTALVAR